MFESDLRTLSAALVGGVLGGSGITAAEADSTLNPLVPHACEAAFAAGIGARLP
jgi:hypothetical protein